MIAPGLVESGVADGVKITTVKPGGLGRTHILNPGSTADKLRSRTSITPGVCKTLQPQ
jgi:hypothetical protein